MNPPAREELKSAAMKREPPADIEGKHGKTELNAPKALSDFTKQKQAVKAQQLEKKNSGTEYWDGFHDSNEASNPDMASKFSQSISGEKNDAKEVSLIEEDFSKYKSNFGERRSITTHEEVNVDACGGRHCWFL